MSATAIVVFFMLLAALVQPVLWQRAMVAALVVSGLGAIAVTLARRGRSVLASWLYVGGLIALVVQMSINAGGVRSPGIGMLLLFVLMAGLLLGNASGLLAGVICAVITAGLAVAEVLDWLPPATVRYTAPALWLLFCIYLAVILVLQRLTAGALRAALQRAEAELKVRTETETQLRFAVEERDRLVNSLAERIKELALLHGAARLLPPDRPLDEGVLADLVTMIPPAWKHPGMCVARIRCGEFTAATPRFRESPWMLRHVFHTETQDGEIEVGYVDPPPGAEPVFLEEEHNLMASLAELLRTHLAREESDLARRALERQLHQSQKLQALGTLAGGIAHDFNNILAAVQGNAELGMSHGGTSAQVDEHFRQIIVASRRASELVRRILAFARHQTPDRRPLTPRPVVEEALELVGATLDPRIRVEVAWEGDLPVILADAGQLHQVLMNLTTNAAHAMSAHGGVLRVTLDRVEVGDLMFSPSAHLCTGTHLRITVADTGTGMSAQVLERVFEPFFTTKGTHGTGLGLAVVHGIVAEHDGAITIESEEGRGTTVRVYLPSAGPDATTATADTPAIGAGGGRRVMYVDDEEAVVFVMTRVLERLGYQPSGYTDPHLALQAFRTAPDAFDVVVTDAAMPGMTGLELARSIRALRPSIRIALSSGYRDDLGAAAREAGVDLMIPKPATIESLGAGLQELLRAS